mgnify:FL=1
MIGSLSLQPLQCIRYCRIRHRLQLGSSVLVLLYRTVEYHHFETQTPLQNVLKILDLHRLTLLAAVYLLDSNTIYNTMHYTLQLRILSPLLLSSSAPLLLCSSAPLFLLALSIIPIIPNYTRALEVSSACPLLFFPV